MRNVVKKTFLFIALTIVFSFLVNCGGAKNETGATNEKMPPVSNVTTGDTAKESKSSEYPPLASNIAQTGLELVDGSVAKIEDRKGKVILLNLWGIWCGPCRAEMPSLIALQEQYKDKDFQIIGLNVGDEEGNPENVDAIKTFAEKMKLNYELARINEKTTGDFMKISKSGGVPQSFLIDREGHLRGVFLGGGGSTVGKLKESVEKVVNE